MSGFITNGVPTLTALVGNEQLYIDTENTQGEQPESGSLTLLQLATELLKLQSATSAAPVAGTRYFIPFSIGTVTQLTGIEFCIGATGGTDSVIAELHGPLVGAATTSAVVASSSPTTPGGTGTVVGTALTWQQLAFVDTAGNALPYLAQPGQYWLSLQFSGNTARYEAYNAPAVPTVVLTNGSTAGVFGTAAAIAPPTTYTAGTGPIMQPYQ